MDPANLLSAAGKVKNLKRHHFTHAARATSQWPNILASCASSLFGIVLQLSISPSGNLLGTLRSFELEGSSGLRSYIMLSQTSVLTSSSRRRKKVRYVLLERPNQQLTETLDRLPAFSKQH